MGSKRLRQGTGLLACGVVFAGVAGHAAAQGPPGPQPVPPSAHASIRPQPAPSAPTPSAPASTPSLTPAYVVPIRTSVPGHTRPVERRTRTRSTTTPAARLGDPRPFRSLASWLFRGKLLATSTAGPSSGPPFLLLFVGFALVLLAIGETRFLRLAARAPKERPPSDERLPIRRVQLRR